MTLRPDLEALLQGALDDTLTPEERERLDRLMSDSVEARGRAAHLRELADLLASLGPSDPPATLVRDVLAQISHSDERHSAGVSGHAEARPAESSQGIRHRPADRRGMAANKTIIFGLAAAAALVLAVIAFTGDPPDRGGTEATIGVAAPAVLQPETWDQLVKDETLRTLLQDASFLARLQDLELQRALIDERILRVLRDPELSRKLQDEAFLRSLDDSEMLNTLDDANLRAALMNRAFLDALRNTEFRAKLAGVDVAAAMAGPAFQNALRDRGFDAAIRSERFAEALAQGTRF